MCLAKLQITDYIFEHFYIIIQVLLNIVIIRSQNESLFILQDVKN